VAYEPPEPDYLALAAEGRCRLVLTSPGLFEASPDQAPYLGGGWLPRGLSRGADGGLRLALPGLDARLICAAVPRGQTVSGWDLARGRPKAAQRAVPAGSVYWLEDLSTTPEALRKLASDGLWPESGYDAQRRAEGFNRCALAPY
jgi:CRISPR-associated protein Cmr3